MKPKAHRVYTFSRLFSDFQNSLALRNTTESSLTEGRSCFALRLIGQGTEMSVFFPHLSKAEHARQTKKYPGNPCFPRFPAPCEAEHRRQPGRPYFGTFDHTGADSVSRLHLGKGRKRSPDVFCYLKPLLYGGVFQFSTYICVFRQNKREPNFFGSPSICPQTYTPIHVQIVSSSQLFFKALHTLFQQNSSR